MILFDFDSKRKRLLWYRRIGQENISDSLQVEQETWAPMTENQRQACRKSFLLLDGELEESASILADILSKEAMISAKDWRDIALLYFRGGELDKAEQAVVQSQSGKRTPNDLLLIEARIRMARNDFNKAKELLLRCIEGSRSNTSTLANLCQQYLKQIAAE